MTALDMLRLVVWVVGGFVLGATFMVAMRHLRMWRESTHKRLLPLHVWTIALSYDLLLAALLSRTGPADWRAFIYIPAILLGAVAMVVMLRYQSVARRGHDATP